MDCGARRQENGFVLRIRGSEYLLSEDEWNLLFDIMCEVHSGAEEAISYDFAEAIEESKSRQRPEGTGIDLVQALGLGQTIKRRF